MLSPEARKHLWALRSCVGRHRRTLRSSCEHDKSPGIAVGLPANNTLNDCGLTSAILTIADDTFVSLVSLSTWPFKFTR